MKRGDRIAVVATGFAARREALEQGIAALRRRGFDPVVGKSAFAIDGYLAGADALRAADLDTAIADDTIAAIWFARGGYGTARLLDRIDLARLVRHPKPLLGYSDLSALFAALLGRARTVCFHAPVVAELGDAKAYHAPSLNAMLAGRTIQRRISARATLTQGRARGRLLGGNLTVLCHLLGTRYMPSLKGAVLFLEETGEEAYRVDRLLQHLRSSGVLKGVAAVLLGMFHTPPTKRSFPPDRPLGAVLKDHLAPLGVPVASGIPAGHGPGKWTLPLGGTATIDTAAGLVTFDPRPAPPA